MNVEHEDSLVFAPEPGAVAEEDGPRWRVLVVDDDPDVHAATVLALEGERICDRRLGFTHAHSAAAAETILAADGEFAVILLDVVMESAHAGLELVDKIRRRFSLHRPRIILRTGQPGYAPELSVVRDLDINDYRTKQSLSRTQLLTLLTAAIRAYEQIVALDRSNFGLEQILETCSELPIEQGLPAFADAALRGLARVLGQPADGVFCTRTPALHGMSAATVEAVIDAGSGPLARMVGQELSALGATALHRALQAAIDSGQLQCGPNALAFILKSRTAAFCTMGVVLAQPLDAIGRRLASVYAHSVAAVADTHRLMSSLHTTAYTDALLGIANRAAIVLEIDTLLAAGAPSNAVLLLVDIDQFSEINEAFGDALGDALLRAVATRLRHAFAHQDLVGRIANDTFGVVAAKDGLQRSQLDQPRLDRLFVTPFDVDGTAITITASFGRVDLGAEVRSGSEAIKFGHSALKRAKAAGPGSHATYAREFGVVNAERTRLLQDLHAAFDQDRLFLAFQPQLQIDGRNVVGLEALMRWRTEAGVLVPPDRFIPIAEQSGLILALGAWALRAALRASVELAAAGYSDLRMAVNVSMPQMLDPQFDAVLDAALAQTGAKPSTLELEITESIAMQSPELIAGKLQRLRARGIAVAIDDFGTGFSSLAYLERLSADRLKIDRSFVNALGRASSGERIAEMVIELGKTLGMKVIAEGVETEEQRQRLAELGCDEVQGYLFSPPLAPDRLLPWLQRMRGA